MSAGEGERFKLATDNPFYKPNILNFGSASTTINISSYDVLSNDIISFDSSVASGILINLPQVTSLVINQGFVLADLNAYVASTTALYTIQSAPGDYICGQSQILLNRKGASSLLIAKQPSNWYGVL